MATELISPGAAEFRALFRTFQRSVFRLETLQVYATYVGEEASVAAFVAGRREPPDPTHDAWVAQIAENVRAGKAVQRVHVVREPLSSYLRYELTWGYAPNVRAGEDVRIVALAGDDSWPGELPEPGVDFWLFDSRKLYRQHYDDEGRLQGMELVVNPTKIASACSWRDVALRLGISWEAYLRGRPELAGHLALARASSE